MMLLTIDNDLLSFPRDIQYMNRTSHYNYSTSIHHSFNTNSNNSSLSNSETNTPNSFKQNKNDTPYRNGFKKSFIKYHQQLALLSSNSNPNTPDRDVRHHQSTYQKSSERIINHLPIHMHSSIPDHSSSTSVTANNSPLQSPSNNSSYSRDSDFLMNLSPTPIMTSDKEILPKSSTSSNINPSTKETSVKTYIHKIEKINRALPLKAKFKLATKENL